MGILRRWKTPLPFLLLGGSNCITELNCFLGGLSIILGLNEESELKDKIITLPQK